MAYFLILLSLILCLIWLALRPEKRFLSMPLDSRLIVSHISAANQAKWCNR